MFSGFWSWVLVIVVVSFIFCADDLPGIKANLIRVWKKVHQGIKDRTKELDAGMNNRIHKKKKLEEEAKKEDQSNPTQDQDDDQNNEKPQP